MRGGFFMNPSMWGEPMQFPVITSPFPRIPTTKQVENFHKGKKKTNVTRPKPAKKPKVTKAQLRDIIRGINIPSIPKHKVEVNHNPMMY